MSDGATCQSTVTARLKFLPDHNDWNLRAGCVSKLFYSKNTEITRCSAAVFWSEAQTGLLHFTLATQHENSPISSSTWKRGSTEAIWEENKHPTPKLMYLTFCLFWQIAFSPHLGSSSVRMRPNCGGKCETKCGEIAANRFTHPGGRQACGECVIMWRWHIHMPKDTLHVLGVLLEAHFTWGGVITISSLCKKHPVKRELNSDLTYLRWKPFLLGIRETLSVKLDFKT